MLQKSSLTRFARDLGPGTGHCLAELILDGKVSSANISRLGP